MGRGTFHGVGEKWDDMEDRDDRDDRSAHNRRIADRGPEDLFHARCCFMDQHRSRCFWPSRSKPSDVPPALRSNAMIGNWRMKIWRMKISPVARFFVTFGQAGHLPNS